MLYYAECIACFQMDVKAGLNVSFSIFHCALAHATSSTIFSLLGVKFVIKLE
jgi:hypothetical protein